MSSCPAADMASYRCELLEKKVDMLTEIITNLSKRQIELEEKIKLMVFEKENKARGLKHEIDG